MFDLPPEEIESVWDTLLLKIKHRKCIPFLGAGACYGALPLGGEIARAWSEKYKFPLANSDNLIEVSQYLAVLRGDPWVPKSLLLEEFKAFKQRKGLDFTAANEPHSVLAELPVPLYLTTNYDDFMVQALAKRDKHPRREMCRWYEALNDGPTIFDEEFEFHPATPVVFHLHGQDTMPESLVLTEDDYLTFLTNMARNPSLIPPPIQRSLATSSCLFIGYRLADWNFRVLFQGLRSTLKSMNVAVLLPPGDSAETKQRAKEYLNRYYKSLDLRIYWGAAKDFCQELRQRWRKLTNEG